MKGREEDYFGNVAVRWRIIIRIILVNVVLECGARIWTEFMVLWMGFGDRLVNIVMIYRFP
jgi:hypothetical protein